MLGAAPERVGSEAWKGLGHRRSTTGRLLKVTALSSLAILVFMPLSAGALSSPLSSLQVPTLVQFAESRCNVTGSPTTCQGAYTTNSTFSVNLAQNELVTLSVAYLYGDSDAVNMTFSDSLGNAPSVVSSQCAGSSPDVCTAVGYFLVTNTGDDDVYYTIQGGTTGELWYTAAIWHASFSRYINATGASSSCLANCTGFVSLGPLSVPTARGAIAESAYVGFYPYTPAAWQPSFPYTFSLTDSQNPGGDSALWQATGTLMASYSFNATTTPTPNSWGGSSLVVYWNNK